MTAWLRAGRLMSDACFQVGWRGPHDSRGRGFVQRREGGEPFQRDSGVITSEKPWKHSVDAGGELGASLAAVSQVVAVGAAGVAPPRWKR